MFTLAHLSDPHVPSPLAFDLRALASKRAFGYWSWQRRRVHIHSAHVLEALTRDLTRIGPNHVVVTGDLVNISLLSEFPAAALWLKTLGPPERVSVVPGNHDAYVGVPWDRSLGLWAAYMSGDDDPGRDGPSSSPTAFPYVRRRGGIAIVGLSTALPTPPGSAAGRLGRAQLERLEPLLANLGAAGLCRVVLLHHPPLEGDNPQRKRLVDANALQAVIARQGAELLLHGHDHRCSIRTMAGPAGGIPAVGVPSASARLATSKPIGQYHLYTVTPGTRGWTIDLQIQRYNAASGRFEDAGGHRLGEQAARDVGMMTPLAANA